MAKISINYYYTWIAWWTDTAIKAVHNLDAHASKRLIDGAKKIMFAIFSFIQDFPEFKGSALSIGMNLYRWAKTNKDPFKYTRELMEELKIEFKDYGN